MYLYVTVNMFLKSAFQNGLIRINGTKRLSLRGFV